MQIAIGGSSHLPENEVPEVEKLVNFILDNNPNAAIYCSNRGYNALIRYIINKDWIDFAIFKLLVEYSDLGQLTERNNDNALLLLLIELNQRLCKHGISFLNVHTMRYLLVCTYNEIKELRKMIELLISKLIEKQEYQIFSIFNNFNINILTELIKLDDLNLIKLIIPIIEHRICKHNEFLNNSIFLKIIDHQRIEILKLIKHCLNHQHVDQYGETKLYYLIGNFNKSDKPYDMLEMLLPHYNIFHQNKQGDTVLTIRKKYLQQRPFNASNFTDRCLEILKERIRSFYFLLILCVYKNGIYFDTLIKQLLWDYLIDI